MSSFYLFFYDSNIKDLLLTELKFKHPKLTLSFSNKELISMKGPANYEGNLEKNPVLFSKRQATFKEKLTSAPSEDDYIKLNENQYWSYEIIDTYNDYLDMEEIEMPKESPARAYHKMREAHLQFGLEINPGDQVIEIGSAPGGISYYLLNLGVKLICVDPAVMDKSLKEKFPNSFKHIKASIFDVDRRDVTKNCDWIISDLNLIGDLNVDQTKRIMDYYKDLKGAFITIKTPKTSDLRRIPNWVKSFGSDYDVLVTHLPSHRREIGLIIHRNS
jgi:hypothetical protein